MNGNVSLMGENVFQINGGITINVYVSVKNFRYVKKIICGVSLHVVVKMQIVSKYYGWFSHYMWWSHRGIWRKNKNYSTNFNEKKAICKTPNASILIVFLLIIIVLLIAVSIYCYFIKYWSKQKHL